MSNGYNGFFVFVEQGTDPRLGAGFDAPVGALCTFGGAILLKSGEAATDWTAQAGGFEGGTVPDATTFENIVVFEDNANFEGDNTFTGASTFEGPIIGSGNLDVAGDTTFGGPAFHQANVTIENGGDLSLASGSNATFGSDVTVSGQLQTTNVLRAGSGPEVLHAGAGSLGFFAAVGTGQVGAIADAAGGATVDAEARTALNSLLAACRGYGLIDT